MNTALAIAGGVGTSAVLLLLTWLLHRRLRIVRQLSFVLTLASIAAGPWVFLNLSGGTWGTVDLALDWLLLLLIVVLILKVVGLFFFELQLPARGIRLPDLLPKVTFGTAYLIAAFITLKVAFPWVEFGALLAASAVTSLVLGLALQPILGNFFAGLVISAERPFRINDWIRYGEIEARVVSINWRTTHLRTRDNDNLVVPNSKIASEDILNYFYPNPLHMERIYVGAHYRHPPYLVKTAMLDAARRVPQVLDKPSTAVFLHDFADSAIVYELRAWIEDMGEKPAIVNRIKSAIWEEFRRHGLTIPFPIRTLEIEPRVNRVAVEEAEPVEAPQTTATGRLVVLAGDESGNRYHLGTGATLLGRSQESDVTLSDSRASSKHASVEWVEGEGYYLEDLESQNGTRVNGHPVERHRLRDLDRIEIGDTVLVFESHE
ncbi:MAG: mechanosensitive ion channel [Thermoanaerobaculia bacterium]|nr:mechanosensitive ion channel [Thermoanaerobaculia bacterium]